MYWNAFKTKTERRVTTNFKNIALCVIVNGYKWTKLKMIIETTLVMYSVSQKKGVILFFALHRWNINQFQ